MEILEAASPIIVFVLSALFTIPIIKVSRKRMNGKKLIFYWFSAVFMILAVTVANLALKYYAWQYSSPYINIGLMTGGPIFSSSSFLIDALSIYMTIIFTAVGALVFAYSLLYIDFNEEISERYYSIMLMVTGCIIGASLAGDLLTLFIFWEATVAGSSFLILYRRNLESIHATLRYLTIMIIASAFIIYGLSIIYALAGTLNFWAVKHALMMLKDKHMLELAFIFIASGYSIEAAIAPFHMWLPDAYAAAPSSSAAFMSALVDQGSYYILLRILLYILTPPTILPWTLIFAFLSALTMITGNLLALTEWDLKRLIADVCIADVGYNLVAITSATPLGIMGNLFFFLVGGITTALAFMTIGVLNNLGFKTLEDLTGIGRRMPFTSLALLLAILSFIGVPFLAGFYAKYLVFTAAIEANMGWLAVIGVLTTIIQSAYLLRLINYMYAGKKNVETKIREPRGLLSIILVMVAAIIFLGIYPTIVLNLINPVIEQFSSAP